MFASEYNDVELGLYYYNFRHNAPINGRWISRDSIEELAGQHSYIFACNSPNDLIDSYGLIAASVAFSWGPTTKSFAIGIWGEGDVGTSGSVTLEGEYDSSRREISGSISGMANLELGYLLGKSYSFNVFHRYDVMGRAGLRFFAGTSTGVKGTFKYDLCKEQGAAFMKFPAQLYGGAEVIAKFLMYQYYKWGNQYGHGHKVKELLELSVTFQGKLTGILDGEIECDEKMCTLRTVLSARWDVAASMKIWRWNYSVHDGDEFATTNLGESYFASPLKQFQW